MKNCGQLFKGLLSTCLVVGLSLVACLSVRPEWLTGWGTLLLVSMVPTQMVISLLLQGEHPRQLARLAQPWRGLAFVVLTVGVGSIVAVLTLHTVGRGMLAPTPFVNMYLIFTVPVALCLIVPLQAWPMSRFISHPLALGAAVLAGTYLGAYGLFGLLFDFGFLADAPFYRSSLDPGGLFMAWTPLVASIASVAWILVFVLLDFWPLTRMCRRYPALGKQPVFGLAAGLLITIGTGAMHWIFVVGGGMDLVLYQTRICVAWIFGLFIVLVMFEGLPMVRFPQPWRGLLLVSLAITLAFLMMALYDLLAGSRLQLPEGKPAHVRELWLASSILAVTFPAMVAYAQFFQFWPLGLYRPGPAPHADLPRMEK